MKIIIDTNVLVSGILWENTESLILNEIVNHNFEGIASPEIIDEYKHGLTKALYKTNKELKYDFARLLESFNVFNCNTKIFICRDYKDNKFLGCAIDTQAYYIVSGDKDLLSIKEDFKEQFNVEIITAKDFCNKFLSAQEIEEKSSSMHM